MRSEFITKFTHVLVNSHYGRSEDNRGSFVITVGDSQVAIEFAVLPGADLNERA